MEPRIVERDELLLVGMAALGGDIGALWQAFMQRENAIQHVLPGIGYEVHSHGPDHVEGEPHHVFIGSAVSQVHDVPVDMVVKRVPAGTYALFSHHPGIDSYQTLNERIAGFLSSSHYQEAATYSLQVYDERFRGMEDPASVIDLLVPVRLATPS